MAYEVLARKWRPKLFSEVVGQEHVTRTLVNALRRGKVPHAFIFAGPRGCGKTTTARLLAKALNCERRTGPEPCNACPSCIEIEKGASFDVREIDGATYTGVDNIRQLQEELLVAPVRGRYRVYIVDEVHMLSTSAFNAFLKTLEEPPEHVKFIFATTELHKVLPTVRSRCQVFRFRRLSLSEIREALRRIADAEGLVVTDEALAEIAAVADGGLRDALVLLDQIAAFSEPGEELTVQTVREAVGAAEASLVAALAEAISRTDLASALSHLAEAHASGAELRHLLDSLLTLAREALLASCGAELDVPPEEKRTAEALARAMGKQRVVETLQVLSDADVAMRRGVPQRLAIELALVRLCAGRDGSAPTASPRPTPARIRRAQAAADPGRGGNSAPPQSGQAQAEAGAVGENRRRETPGEPPGDPEISAKWDEFLAHLKDEHGTTYVRLSKGRLVSVEENRVHICFGPNGRTALRRLKERRSYETLGRLAESFFGRPLAFNLYLEGDGEGEAEGTPGDPGDPPERNPDRSPLDHPDVRKAIELFAGKVVHVRRGSVSNDQNGEDT